MAIPAWPDCFPLPQVSGYTVNMGDANNVRGGGGFGPVTSRNRMTRQTAAIAVLYIMTEAQFGIFEALWKHTLNDGASWFTHQQNIEGLENNTCRFSGGYAAALQIGGAWSVSGTLTIDEPYRSA